MSEKKQELINLIMNQNVSAIYTLSTRLEITTDEVIQLINDLIEEGNLKGTLTEDHERFFKSDIKLSAAPTIAREDDQPSFLTFNARPGKVTAIVGFLIVIAGLIVNAFATDAIEQNFAALLVLFGILIIITGLYCLSRRETPS
jgi:hypothetical protein